jgi:putative glutathione S-transferase
MDKAKEAAGILGWADKKTGAFNRQTSVFRNFISKDPNAQFPAEKGRYHLYVSYACPWGKAIPSWTSASSRMLSN